MTDFICSAASLRDAANTGLARAAETLALALRARGLATHGIEVADGRARVTIEGAGLVAREFGTLTRAAQPVVAPVVRAQTREIVRVIAAEIGRVASSSEALGQRRIP